MNVGDFLLAASAVIVLGLLTIGFGIWRRGQSDPRRTPSRAELALLQLLDLPSGRVGVAGWTIDDIASLSDAPPIAIRKMIDGMLERGWIATNGRRNGRSVYLTAIGGMSAIARGREAWAPA